MTDTITGALAHDWISRFSDDFVVAQDRLTDLDRLAGDGDFGTNIASALRRATSALPDRGTATFAAVLSATSRGFLATGGTSGPLFGMWFRDISRAGSPAGASSNDLAAGVAAGLSTIQRLGGARVGDNTMVDALAPAAVALSDAARGGGSLSAALVGAAAAARTGAESTADLVASRGRASYVGELARGVLDPGAVTIALFFESGASVIGAREASRPLEWLDSLIA